jgi:hypothetical protein
LHKWIKDYYVHTDPQLLPKIKEFAYDIRSASAQEDRASDLLSSIENRVRTLFS